MKQLRERKQWRREEEILSILMKFSINFDPSIDHLKVLNELIEILGLGSSSLGLMSSILGFKKFNFKIKQNILESPGLALS